MTGKGDPGRKGAGPAVVRRAEPAPGLQEAAAQVARRGGPIGERDRGCLNSHVGGERLGVRARSVLRGLHHEYLLAPAWA